MFGKVAREGEADVCSQIFSFLANFPLSLVRSGARPFGNQLLLPTQREKGEEWWSRCFFVFDGVALSFVLQLPYVAIITRAADTSFCQLG